jgi:hypothetical protein
LEKRKKYFLEDMEITTTSYSTVTWSLKAGKAKSE